jgi:hypothetical protein
MATIFRFGYKANHHHHQFITMSRQAQSVGCIGVEHQGKALDKEEMSDKEKK